MRSILEKAIVHLLNEENEQAQALFHKFMVERARQIHESLRSGEDALLESFDDTSSDEMFEEGDLTGLEDDSSESTDDAAPEFGGESSDDSAPAFGGEDETAPTDADSSDDESSDFGGEDMPVDGEEGEGSTEDRLADLEDQLTSLQQEFDSLMGGEGHDDMGAEPTDSMDMPSSDEETMGGEVDGSMDSGEGSEMAGGLEDDMSEENPVHESEDDESEDDDSDEETLEEEDFDDITESVISELEKVMVSMTDGKEIGAGKSFSQQNTSPALQKKPNPMADGKPVSIKAEEHKGFERETPPSSKDMKKRKNTKSKADDGQSKVSKEGDKSALINKTPGAESNTKSPLAKR
jgi:hypothetical protein